MTAKQRIHLTPEEVQEFSSLGVDFGNTTIIWAIDEDNYAFLFPRASHICRMKSWRMLPAPNLQEVLNAIQNSKLSLYMECRFHSLTLKDEHNYWEAEFTSPDNGVGFSECDVSLLEATVYCLQDVFNYNPKILT